MTASAQMPKFRCHKEVHALKIRRLKHEDGIVYLVPFDSRFAEFPVEAEYISKHNPQPGGYYVVYADGYKSFSPAEAFEKGYSPI